MDTPISSVGSRGDKFRAARRRVADQPLIALAVILVLLLGLLEVVSPGYLTPRSLSSTLQLGAILGIMAAGQTLVLLTAGVDLSVASTASAAAYIMASFNHTHGPVVGILAGLAVGVIVGLVNGLGVGVFGVPPLIMTLGVGGVVSGLLTVYVVVLGAGAPVVPAPIAALGGGTVLQYLPWDVLLIWFPLAVILLLGLRYSGLGRAIIAVGDNPVACRLTGVRVWQVLLATYTISAMLAAVSGIVLGGYLGAVDQGLATPYLLPSVAAVVLGGTSVFGGMGGYGGTIFGVLILQVLDTILTVMKAEQWVRNVLYGAIILILTWAYARLTGTE